jgi:hypothetical protein
MSFTVPSRRTSAELDDRDAVADELHLAQQVGVEEDRLPFRLEADEQAADFLAPHGIDAVGRLVEEQDARVVEHRLREAEPLLHALRVGPHFPPRGVFQADDFDQPGIFSAAFARAETAEAAVELERRLGGVVVRQAVIFR